MKMVKFWLINKNILTDNKTNESNTLNNVDIVNAEHFIIKTSQIESFPQEYIDLKYNKAVHKNSKLLSLHQLMKDELIIVGGRIGASYLPFEFKHQFLIQRHHPLAELITRYIHESNCHAGREQTLSLTREKYWIVQGRGLVKRLISNCSYCRRLRILPSPTIMSNLPQ